MLRLIITLQIDGRTVIDAEGPEELVKTIAERFRDKRKYLVRILYP